ncbi:MAG: response regulator [Pirellulales bacterium]|nr:response regulator [Pirellulales bacterium]
MSMSHDTTDLHTPKLRVLVVDDRRDAVHMMATLLNVSGFDVQTATDGHSALQACVTYQPQIVVLDIGLPDISGWLVAEKLRADPRTAEIVLVAVTGYGQEADRQRSLAAGFDYHLIKPADFEEVREICSSVQDRLRLV